MHTLKIKSELAA